MKAKYTTLLAMGALCLQSHAADGIWTADAPGNWTDIANWNSGAGPIADGVDFTATFGNVITGNHTVTLNADRTIGNITASDTTHNYTISGANILTLDVTTGAPTIDVITSRSLFISSVIAGNDGLTKTGNGTLLLQNDNNTFTGNITISAGTLKLGDNSGPGSLGGGSYAGDISIATGATFWDQSNSNQILSGVISGGGNFIKSGGASLTLSGNNTYTGKTIIGSGGAGGRSLSVSSFNSVNGGTPLMASSSLGAPTTVENGTIQLGDGGNVRSSTLIYTGSGETTDRVINVQFNSSSQQTLNASGSGLLKFTSAMTSNATSQTGSFNISGTGAGEITQDLPALATGGLRKLDAGTWTLAGGTVSKITVEGGKLLVNGTMNVTTTVAVSSGATLGGSGTVGGAITVNNGGTLSPGNSAGQFNVGNSLNLGGATATSNTVMELGGTTLGTTYDHISLDALATALTYGGNLSVANLGLFDMDLTSFTYDLFDLQSVTPTGDFNTVTVNSIALSNSGGLWSGSNGDVSYSFAQTTGDLTITVIPEPSAALLGGLGLLALLRRRRN